MLPGGSTSNVAADQLTRDDPLQNFVGPFKDLRYLRVAVDVLEPVGFPVAVFDGSILATAAVSAPDVMMKLIGTVLVGFDDLPDGEREMLFETFRVWQDSDASVRSAAEVRICHPNTVRHRLRRIEQRTSRSLSRPKDVAELCLTFEVRRRLI
jgi:hypothetical protein